ARIDRRIYQQQRRISFRPQGGGLDRGVTAHGMSYAQRAAKLPMFGNGRQVGTEIPPVIWRLRLTAAAVAPGIDRQAVPLAQHADDVIPAPPMKPGGVRKQ